ncbi:hypothetical protein GCM10010208_46210 [Actinomadura livida]|nr:hypothetical protein GCM10010208_46210 [Actinomadura livida]
MEDPRQDEDVTVGRQRGEEAPRREGAAVGEPGRGELPPPRLDDGRQVDERSPQAGVLGEQGGQERARAASDVHHVAHVRPVVGGGDLVGHQRDLRRHQRVEGPAALGVGLQVRPERPPEHVLVGGPPGAHDLEHPGQRHVGAPQPAVHVQPGPQAVVFPAREQQAGQLRQRELSRFRLREHALGGEVPQQPLQGRRIRAAPRAELVGAPCTGLDQVGQPQRGGDPDGVRRDQVGQRAQPPHVVRVRSAARRTAALCSTHRCSLPPFGF